MDMPIAGNQARILWALKKFNYIRVEAGEIIADIDATKSDDISENKFRTFIMGYLPRQVYGDYTLDMVEAYLRGISVQVGVPLKELCRNLERWGQVVIE